ncbi:urea ABC transporter permease subunit UrtB [Candidatus Methylomicrobium oryzae]|uniref:urea ABC transporter permease subunit UrtB n=1 Tax=Candidatus Methylomicrobium oryzae TaxID=2802053 RepID=UPI0019247385|nr:urea ABC transporter permease subunit UrtB [Methylomicrobium sp. RS1]MBL1263434.1 urea ABC transporter permease subunit UrtB [Methylomicrobium sp. RS1]
MIIKTYSTIIGLTIALLLPIGSARAEQPGIRDAYAEAVAKVGRGSMAEREQGIAALAEAGNPRSLDILRALLDGRLYQEKSTGALVIAEKNAGRFKIEEASNGADLGFAEAEAIGRINITNRIRGELRKLIGQLGLGAEDASARLAAVREMTKDPDQKTLELLQKRSAVETDQRVKRAIDLIFLVRDLDSGDKTARIRALKALQDYDSQEVVNKLNAMLEPDGEGGYAEADADIRNQAKITLHAIDTRIGLYHAAETVFFGLSLGAVLVLAAIGLAITFGVMGVINMAHGELMMLGAYTTYVIQQLLPDSLGLSIFLAIPAAFLISALAGLAIERGLIRFLYGRPLETLLATFGVSLILQQGVRSIFSPLNRSVATPSWMSGSWQINDFLSLTWNRFYILIFCLLVFTALLQILKRTRLGLEVRAVAQNRRMAKAMGIPTDRVDAMTFALGSGIAGVAGVALSQITNVGPNLGQAYIVDSFMVVVFGGVGNLFGTLVAGFSLGIANKFLEPYAGAVLAKILVLVFIILFIQKRPRGLFPQKGRAAEA